MRLSGGEKPHDLDSLREMDNPYRGHPKFTEERLRPYIEGEDDE